MTDNNELKGLDGWLILVGIGVVIGPLRMLYMLFATYQPVFENGAWEALTTVGSTSFIPYYGPFLIAEIVINSFMLMASIYLIYLFFSKHYFFPKLYITISVASLIFILMDAWVATKIFPGASTIEPGVAKEFIQTLIGCLVWVPYMLFSKRVKVTFVESMPNNMPSSDCRYRSRRLS